MANVTETNSWAGGVYRLELTDPAEGGENGIMNEQAKQLASRTQFLRKRAAIWTGKLTFGSADYVTVDGANLVLAQTFGAQGYAVDIVPLEDTEGSLGDVWVEQLSGSVRVHRTGEFQGDVQATIWATVNDNWQE